jgi:mono/diheme cytochrome c family protein
VPSDKACYTCHTNYTMYGPLKAKLRGLTYLYMEYLSTPPKTLHLIGRYPNSQCLHCHMGTRDFEDNLAHMKPLALLKSNQVSCISSGCHDMIHNVSKMDHLKMWTGGPVASDSTSASPANAKPAAANGPVGGSAASPANAKPAAANGPVGGSAGKTAHRGGKAIFNSHGCTKCHGKAGDGGAGPALTHISSQYPSAKLTALLKAPTAKMKTAGMVPLTLKAADMKALVTYLGSLGGKSAAAAATPSISGSSSASPANAKPAAANGPVVGSAGKTAGSGGMAIFDSHGCKGCHGEAGGGGAGPALTHISSQYPSAKLTALLKAPTAKMKTAGMVPLTLNAADMKALVTYLGSLGGGSAASVASREPSAAAASSEQEPAATYHSFCASCHGDSGKGNGHGAVAFDPAPADFTDCAKMKMRSDEFLYEVVAKGGSAEGLSRTMPGWSEAFTDSEIHGLVEYLRSFCR